MSLLDVTGEHVMALDDKQLRDLVERLCSAESRRLGLPLHALTDGGHQNAPDGGVDVRIELPHGADAAPCMDFIRRKHAVFQCKAEDMPPKAIAKEMKPGGVLRPVIGDLIRQGGAYIIVSSVGTVTDSRLTERKQAMRTCVMGLAGAQDLLLDFYDRKRLARWACQYPGVAAWVRKWAGQPIDGWKAHGEWAAPRDKHTPYLADAHPRLWAADSAESAPQPIAEGVRRLRDTLARQRGVARLVGLSGTGKTRLAQALFEPDLDPEAVLDRAVALYADLADDGRDRLAFLAQLQADDQRAIIVLDNCPPDQHRRFADLCAAEGSRLSLLTINLDVQDDRPEGTQVFRLEVASTEVTEQIVRHKPAHAHMRPEARQRIAELAGGNARLALALAHSAPKGSLANISDTDLLNRLFHQGGSRRDDLLRTARAIALVYSFDGGSDGNTAEVSVLAGWAGTDVNTLCDHVAELHRRGLVQRRDVWRAVLPQALAIHLAREALESHPPHILEESLRDAPQRLMRSFTRQLGHLHDSEPAKALVQGWLEPVNGLPRDIAACDAEQLIWFDNIAPVDLCGGALAAIECIAMPSLSQLPVLSDLCVKLAYDEDLFPRATALLARWCAEPKNHHELEVFHRLFQVRLSGTLAQINTRLRTMQALLDDKDAPGHQLGVEALGALLRAGNLSGHPQHSFGARVRDFGLWPVDEQFDDWYVTILAWIAERANGPVRGMLRERVASALPDLCRHVGRLLIAKALASCVTELSTGSVWPEAWVAVNTVIRRNESRANTGPDKAEGDTPEPQTRTCLEQIEALLRPARLADEVRIYVMTEHWKLNFALAQPFSGDAVLAKDADLDGYACELGQALAERPDELATLLPELIASNRSGRQSCLGRGLSMGCTCDAQRLALWNRMADVLTTTAPDRRNIDLLCGFLQGITKQAPVLAQALLDAAVAHPTLGRCLPALQKAGAPIGSTGANRLIRAAAQGLAPAEAFSILQSGDATRSIPIDDLVKLLGVVANQVDGVCVAADVLHMRMFADRPSGGSDPQLVRFGRQILETVCLTCQQHSSGHPAAELVKVCLATGDQPDPELPALAQKLARGMRDQFTQRQDNDGMSQIIRALLLVQPTATLDALFGFGDEPQAANYWRLFVEDNAIPGWLDNVPDDVLLGWVAADPTVRAPRIAAACKYLQEPSDSPPRWTPLARRLIQANPDPIAVLDKFADRFIPNSWSGSRAVIVERRRVLLGDFFEGADNAISKWAHEKDARLREVIANLSEQEKSWERGRQRFEP